MNQLCKFLLLYVFSLAGTKLFARDFPKLHFTVEDGLPSNTVYNVYRDSKGYLWFATDKGVARYNGVRFEKFTTDDGLADNDVFFFKEDHQGRLWIATYNGELCYYKEGKFYSAKNTPFLRSRMKGGHIKFINVEKDSSVTMLTNDKIVVNVTKSGITWLSLDKRLKNDKYDGVGGVRFVLGVSKISPTSYLVAHPYYVCRIDTNEAVENHYEINSQELAKSGKNSPWVTLNGQDNQYLVNWSYIFDGRLNILGRAPAGFESRFTLLGVYKWGNGWIFATNHGAILNDSTTILEKEAITSVTKDAAGNFWLSTLSNGVFELNKDIQNWRLIPDGYDHGIMYARAFDDRGLLFFADDTSNIYEAANGKVKRMLRYRDHFNMEPLHSYGSAVIDDSFRYYYNSNQRSFVVDNLLSGSANIRQALRDLPTYNRLKKSIVLGSGDIYVHSSEQVLTIKPNKKNGGLYTEISVLSDTSSMYRIYTIRQAPDKSIWMSTSKGLRYLENDKFYPWHQSSQLVFRTFEFCGRYVAGITPDNKLLVCNDINGRLTIDTIDNGHCVWDKLDVLDSSHVLVSTNDWYRILSITGSPATHTIEVRVVDDPFLPTRADFVTVGHDNVYFFKGGSILSLKKPLLYVAPDPPKVLFTTINVNGDAKPITGEIGVPYSSSKNIIVYFSALSFNSKNIFYQYSFSRGEDNWVDLTEDRINILSPKYGSYDVKVRARTLSTEFGAPVVFRLRIFKPFWATWWFVIIVVLCAGGVIWILVRKRVAAVLAKREGEHNNKVKFMKSEYKALNALMNPHFIFNTLNNVQSLVNKDDKRAANEYLRIFADLVRQNMHNVSNELIPMEKEMQLVSNYLLLEKLRFKENLHYVINVDEGIDLSEIMVPPLLIQPLVENSIKHGIYPLESAKGTVVIKAYERNNILVVEVRDNGVGLARPEIQGIGRENHISFGLANIRKRVEQLSVIQNREITFEISEAMEQEQKWTIARITMELKNETV